MQTNNAYFQLSKSADAMRAQPLRRTYDPWNERPGIVVLSIAFQVWIHKQNISSLAHPFVAQDKQPTIGKREREQSKTFQFLKAMKNHSPRTCLCMQMPGKQYFMLTISYLSQAGEYCIRIGRGCEEWNFKGEGIIQGD